MSLALQSLSLLLVLTSPLLTVAVRLLTFQYLGCYVEGPEANRDLVGLKRLTQLGPYPVSRPHEGLTSIAGMTLEMCSEICSLGGFTYFGVQLMSFCSCDFTYGSFGPAPEAQCSTNCAGNASQKCGAAYRNSMHRIIYYYGNNFELANNPSEHRVLVSPGFLVNTAMLGASTRQAACVIECLDSSAGCQAALFVPGCRCCYLLPFAALPASLVAVADGSSDGQLWRRL